VGAASFNGWATPYADHIVHGFRHGKPDRVTDREWMAFTLRYRERLTLRRIGEHLGLSQQRAQQLVEKAERLCAQRKGSHGTLKPPTGGTDGTAP
jgi:hypothetical protein